MMKKNFIFNDIVKDANPIHENSLDGLFCPATTTNDFHRTITTIEFQNFECVE